MEIVGFVCSGLFSLGSTYLALTPKHDAGMGQDIFCEEANSNHMKIILSLLTLFLISESHCTFKRTFF